MAQELTTRPVAALPAVDTADPASMLLLPDWLASQIAAVSDLGAGRTEVDPDTRQIVARIPTIPESRMPTGAQRTAIARRIAELQAATEIGPVEETLAALGDLIQEYAPNRLDDRTVSIKAEAYLDAVEDLPAWSVRAAIRRWRRGEVSADPTTLDFAPKPARLRAIADRMVKVAKGQAIRLQRVLDAKAERPATDAERAESGRRAMAEIAETVAGPEVEPAGTMTAERRAALADLERRRLRREAAEQTPSEPVEGAA